MASDFKYGDLICYKPRPGNSVLHDVPLMYVGPCGHPPPVADLIDIIPLDGWADEQYAIINHKDPAMWQKCWHLAKTLDDLS